MKRLIAITLLIGLMQAGFGYSLLNREAGDMVRNFDARTAGMGSASVAGGLSLLDGVVNPANIGLMDAALQLQTSAYVAKNNDDRSLPMYNFFDSYVGDATYATNANFFDDYTFALKYALQLDDLRLAVALSHRPVVNFYSEYDEQVRNDANSNYEEYPPIIARNSIDGKGRIQAGGMQIALSYTDMISAGIGVNYLYGDTSLRRRIVWADAAYDLVSGSTNLQDADFSLKRDFDAAIQLSGGITYRVSQRFVLAGSYTAKTELDATLSGNENGVLLDSLATASNLHDAYDTYTLPAEIRAGVRYEPRNIMRTYFNADVRFVKWSDVSSRYDDVLNYYCGVEHRFASSLPLRMGFMYETTYTTVDEDGIVYGQEITTPGFSLGTGFAVLPKVTVDVAAQFNYRTYECLDLFMDSFYDYPELWNEIEPADRGWDKPDTVKETTVGLTTSISYKW